MIPRLFRRRQPTPAAPLPTVPDDTRVYAIGDVHGCVGLLRTLHELIVTDAKQWPTRRKLLVYLGDYVDRGDDSCGVIDLLLREPLPGFEHIHIKGNHEESLIQFLDDEQIGPNWLTYGGAATLYSYGVHPPDPPTDSAELLRAQAEIIKKLPAEHLDFLRGLPLAHGEGDYLFVHAGLRPNVPIESQSAEDMMWIRDEFLKSKVNFGKIVVHGHSITDLPDVRHNRIGIDTGALQVVGLRVSS